MKNHKQVFEISHPTFDKPITSMKDLPMGVCGPAHGVDMPQPSKEGAYPLEKGEPVLSIRKFKICQLKMCAAIAEELSRQCPGITTDQAQMSAIIEAANLVCNAVNNQTKEQGES
ncbi:hypothetical protein [Vibrio sp. 11-4(1)]|uniref:hypothetical protein n=1 Tax=Vibrio sp. 11-4(1) TaxID=2591018 RepID=UPI0014832100|nr:hypothetical protein [Vibrio sp. 11-4(1)]NNN82167.1 hypothetical protein [Vibrio sp. 11-4(1)]